jgi:hypothetical protein
MINIAGSKRMELHRIKTLSDEGLQDLRREALSLIEAREPARQAHGEVMLSVIGAVVTNRRAEGNGSAGATTQAVGADQALRLDVKSRTPAVHKRRFILMR